MFRLLAVQTAILILKRAIAVSRKLKPRAWVCLAVLQAMLAALCFWGYQQASKREAHTAEQGLPNGFLSQATLDADHNLFEERDDVATGLGPVYNAQSCAECHQNPVTGGVTRFGRFGWKEQQARLLSFSSDAYLNEQGITNRFNLVENTSLGRSVAVADHVSNNQPCASYGANCALVPEDDLQAFTRFMRSTKAPTRNTAIANAQPNQSMTKTLSVVVDETSSYNTSRIVPPKIISYIWTIEPATPRSNRPFTISVQGTGFSAGMHAHVMIIYSHLAHARYSWEAMHFPSMTHLHFQLEPYQSLSGANHFLSTSGDWWDKLLPRREPPFFSQPSAPRDTSLLDVLQKLALLFQSIVLAIGSIVASVLGVLGYLRGRAELKLKQLQIREMEIKLELLELERDRAIQEAERSRIILLS